MRDHTKLRAFALADEVAILTYRETRKFPKDVIHGLTSQMRRTAVSAPSNIVPEKLVDKFFGKKV